MRFKASMWQVGAILVSLGASLGVLIWISRRSEVGLAALLTLLPLESHLAALAALVLSLGARAARLFLLLQAVGHGGSPWVAMKAHLAGEAGGAVTPSRTGYEPARLVVLRRSGLPLSVGAGIVSLELVLEALGVLLVAVVLALWVRMELLFVGAAAVYAGTVTSAVLLAWAVARLPRGIAPPSLWRWVGLGARQWRGFRLGGHRFRRSLRSLRKLPARSRWLLIPLTVLHILSRLAILPLLSLPLMGGSTVVPLLPVPFFLFYGAGMIPLPGGGGAVEMAYATFLEAHLPGVALAGTLLWWRIYTFYIGAAAGAAVLLLGRGGQSPTPPSSLSR